MASDSSTQESDSSRELRDVLEEIKISGSIEAFAEDVDCHRTQLWRYAAGKGKPNANQIARLHRRTKGRVAADGWETPKVRPRPKKKARRAA